MDWLYIFYILSGILLGWSIPWVIMQLSDGMFLLNQIFRITYWGTFAIAYEWAEIYWVYSLLLAHIPGVLIWTCHDHWFDEGDEFEKIDDELDPNIPIESIHKSDSLIVWNIPETQTA